MENIIVGDRVRVSANATGNGLSRIGIVDAIYPDLGTTLVSISFIDDINSESLFTLIVVNVMLAPQYNQRVYHGTPSARMP